MLLSAFLLEIYRGFLQSRFMVVGDFANGFCFLVQYNTIQTVCLVRRLHLQPTQGALHSQFSLQYLNSEFWCTRIFTYWLSAIVANPYTQILRTQTAYNSENPIDLPGALDGD